LKVNKRPRKCNDFLRLSNSVYDLTWIKVGLAYNAGIALEHWAHYTTVDSA